MFFYREYPVFSIGTNRFNIVAPICNRFHPAVVAYYRVYQFKVVIGSTYQ